MDNIIKQIEVDVYSPTFYEVIKAQQGDKNSRFVEFILFNQGEPYTVPDNAIVKLEGSRANKSPIIKPCIIKDNSITIELDEDLLYYHGISHLKLVLYEKDEKSILSTIPFTLSVQKNPLDSDKFEKDNYSLLNQLILQTETVNQNLEKHISDNDDPHTIIYEEPDTISKLTVGEKLSDTFGKLSKAVSDLISHINDNIRHITSTERDNWEDAYNKRHVHSNKDILNNTTASYTTEEKNKLNEIQEGAQVNVQSDWNITDPDSDAYIKNKPSTYTKNEIDNKFSALETNIDWKESVDTFDDIASVHQNPQDGWTVNVKDTDYTYRYNGTEWIPISANAIPKATNSVDGLLSKEDHASYDDANSKKHSHSNKSVIDKITQTLLDNWNAAYSHISDNIKHITSTERSLWNTVSNKVDKISGKGLSTNDFTTEEKNKLANLSSSSVTGVKGNAETTYRKGNVNLTSANIGALATNGDSKSNTVTYTSADVADGNATAWTSVTALTSGLTHATLLNRISQMFKNIRYLYKVLGTSDISNIGNGTVRGALTALNSNYEDITDKINWGTSINYQAYRIGKVVFITFMCIEKTSSGNTTIITIPTSLAPNKQTTLNSALVAGADIHKKSWCYINTNGTIILNVYLNGVITVPSGNTLISGFWITI